MTSQQSIRRARSLVSATAFATGLLLTTNSSFAEPSFTAFESGQVRPLAISPDGNFLFAANTPDNRLEVFRIQSGGNLSHLTSVPVGLEPVAVAARSSSEVWVVNHLSDSVSVVKLKDNGEHGYVARTLLVGDEPRDIVFAGPSRQRAFITTAHRGQNAPFDPQLTTPGVGRADVWVFNAQNLGASLTGTPLNLVTLFSDTPRALAVTPDGSRVYAAAFHSGNRTTTMAELAVPNGFEAAGGLPNPSTNVEGVPAPETGMIVQHDGSHWVDSIGRTWDQNVNFNLPDKDVFVINAMSDPPAQLAGAAGYFTGVGTVIFNLAVNPVNGKVYAANTEALNLNRFEGPGTLAGSSVRGHLHESRISVLSASGVAPRHLNKHIDYGSCCAPVPNAESEKSLAFPQGMAVTSNGAKLYVAALGSSKVGVFNTSALENNTFVPSSANHIEVTGGGPTGLALSENRHRLYVLTRFDNSISIVNTDTASEVGHVPMYNPEPPSVVNGRRFLYDARHTSGHGDSACASCHVFGDFDSLAWDLGNPDGEVLNNPGPFIGPLFNPIFQQPVDPAFHPMKGPMVTQSLRGMANHGAMHWRGDRTGGNDEPSAQPDSGAFDEVAAFKKFQGAFLDLMGRSGPLPDAEMQAFADFILQVTYPPNPVRNLDNSLTADQQAGKEFFTTVPSDFTQGPCSTCHVIDPEGNPGASRPGFFGSDGRNSFEFQTQVFKAAHFRNAYQKVGMFGFPALEIAPGIPFTLPQDHEFMGDQVRGFGYIHDGSFDTIFRFMSIIAFTSFFPGNIDGFPPTAEGNPLRRQAESFLLAFDSNMAPIVGQQTTLTATNLGTVGSRIDLLRARAEAGECDLVAKTTADEEEVGYLYVGAGQFARDRQSYSSVSDAALRQYAGQTGNRVTYTCAPPGSGARLGLDRDEDGYLDGDEREGGSDPADPASIPEGCDHN